MFIASLIQPLLIGLAALLSFGSLVQDTRLNKALEVAAPISSVSVNISSNLDSLNEATSHTHMEDPNTINQMFTGIPRIQARNDHKHYLMPKSVSRNNSFFGATGVIWPSV